MCLLEIVNALSTLQQRIKHDHIGVGAEMTDIRIEIAEYLSAMSVSAGPIRQRIQCPPGPGHIQPAELYLVPGNFTFVQFLFEHAVVPSIDDTSYVMSSFLQLADQVERYHFEARHIGRAYK